MAELSAIWAELQAFGEQIEGVPLAELKDRLTEFEERILGVVRGRRGDRRAETGRRPGPRTAEPRDVAPGAAAPPRGTTAATGGRHWAAAATAADRRPGHDDARVDAGADGDAPPTESSPAGTAEPTAEAKPGGLTGRPAGRPRARGG